MKKLRGHWSTMGVGSLVHLGVYKFIMGCILHRGSAGGSNETAVAMFVILLCCAVHPLCHLLEVKGGWMEEEQEFA